MTLAFCASYSQYMLLSVRFVREGHIIRCYLFITSFSLHRISRRLALMSFRLANSYIGVVQLQLLLENQEHFLWNPSILFLMSSMTVDVASYFLFICKRVVFRWVERCGFIRQGVCVLITFDTAVPRDALEGYIFTFKL